MTNANVINAPITVDAENTRPDTVTLIRHYLPAVATIGWVIGFTLGHIAFFETLGLILIAVGVIAALTVCPLKFLSVPLRCAGKGFVILRSFIPVYGVADLCAAIIGTTFGCMVGLIATLGFPVVFTLRKLKAAKA